LDLIDAGTSGRLISVHNGRYGSVPLDVIIGNKKFVDVDKYYDTERLRPKYKAFANLPLFIMTGDK
jgi:6-phosphofructokinase 1